MKELLGIILLTLLVVLGSCNSNTNVSLMETSPQLFGVRQVSSGNPGYINRELFINESCGNTRVLPPPSGRESRRKCQYVGTGRSFLVPESSR